MKISVLLSVIFILLNFREQSKILHKTVNHNLAVIESVTPERLIERITPQDRTVSILEAIYQVVGHFQQHTGQIMFATKLMTSEDLKIYVPKP